MIELTAQLSPNSLQGATKSEVFSRKELAAGKDDEKERTAVCN